MCKYGLSQVKWHGMNHYVASNRRPEVLQEAPLYVNGSYSSMTRSQHQVPHSNESEALLQQRYAGITLLFIFFIVLSFHPANQRTVKL